MIMKRLVSLLSLVFCMTTVIAQTYKMVVHVNNGTALGFPDGKISIPVDAINEVTFEDFASEVIPEGTTPIIFQFRDYTTPTRSPMTKAPALEARKYGVFGCYNNGEPLNQESLSSNLMKNLEVQFMDGGWKYSPTVNWPEKEQGNNFASFFAYSPYADEGGNGFVSVNSTTTAPVIEYKSINPLDDAGDLLYGNKINATKNDNDGCVNIESRHALTRLNLKTALIGDIGSSTKITIKSVKISGQIPNRGQFDLYRQQWTNLSTETQTYTLEGENLAASLHDAGDTSAANQPEGVTYNSKPIGVSPYLFIPTDGEKEITITLEYCITTDNASLATGYNRGQYSYSWKSDMSLNPGYSYDLQIGFSLTEIRFSMSASSSWINDDVILGF